MPDISHYVKKTFAILSGFMGLSLSKKPDKNRPYQSIRMFDRSYRMPGLHAATFRHALQIR
jgi:hypothetical protein